MARPSNSIYKIFKPLLGRVKSTDTSKHVSSEQNSHEKMANDAKENIMHEVENTVCDGKASGNEIETCPADAVAIEDVFFTGRRRILSIKSMSKHGIV